MNAVSHCQLVVGGSVKSSRVEALFASRGPQVQDDPMGRPRSEWPATRSSGSPMSTAGGALIVATGIIDIRRVDPYCRTTMIGVANDLVPAVRELLASPPA